MIFPYKSLQSCLVSSVISLKTFLRMVEPSLFVFPDVVPTVPAIQLNLDERDTVRKRCPERESPEVLDPVTSIFGRESSPLRSCSQYKSCKEEQEKSQLMEGRCISMERQNESVPPQEVSDIESESSENEPASQDLSTDNSISDHTGLVEVRKNAADFNNFTSDGAKSRSLNESETSETSEDNDMSSDNNGYGIDDSDKEVDDKVVWLNEKSGSVTEIDYNQPKEIMNGNNSQAVDTDNSDNDCNESVVSVRNLDGEAPVGSERNFNNVADHVGKDTDILTANSNLSVEVNSTEETESSAENLPESSSDILSGGSEVKDESTVNSAETVKYDEVNGISDSEPEAQNEEDTSGRSDSESETKNTEETNSTSDSEPEAKNEETDQRSKEEVKNEVEPNRGSEPEHPPYSIQRDPSQSFGGNIRSISSRRPVRIRAFGHHETSVERGSVSSHASKSSFSVRDDIHTDSDSSVEFHEGKTVKRKAGDPPVSESKKKRIDLPFYSYNLLSLVSSPLQSFGCRLRNGIPSVRGVVNGDRKEPEGQTANEAAAYDLSEKSESEDAPGPSTQNKQSLKSWCTVM